jgi:hypothetical protein
MNLQEKRQFINDLVKSVVDEIVQDIDYGKIPEDWNGIELRWLLAYRFADSQYNRAFDKKRKAEFNNTVLINNL